MSEVKCHWIRVSEHLYYQDCQMIRFPWHVMYGLPTVCPWCGRPTKIDTKIRDLFIDEAHYARLNRVLDYTAKRLLPLAYYWKEGKE